MRKLIYVFVLASAVRILASALPSFTVDMNTWIGWGGRMVALGPSYFYSSQVWTQYTPLYLYWLWLGGLLGALSEFWVKIPVSVFDFATGYLIWELVREKSEKMALFGAALYVLSPVVIFVGPVWGQIDGILAFLMLSSVYFSCFKNKFGLGGLLWGLAFLLKPQAFILLPPLAFALFQKRTKFRDYAAFLVSASVAVFILALPFFPNSPLFGLLNLVREMTGFYAYASVFAFNFWGIFAMWKPDSMSFLGISYNLWGIFLYLTANVLIFWKYKKLEGKGAVFSVFSLSLLSAFMFPTRVHERYIFPFFAFFAIATALSKDRLQKVLYIAISTVSFLNLYLAYGYYSDNYLKSKPIVSLLQNYSSFLSGIALLLFFILLYHERIIVYMKKINHFISRYLKEDGKSSGSSLPKINIDEKRSKQLLFAILAFALVTRLVSLSSPRAEYFDEVYHAFTARRMLHGDVKAWEWWNTPPTGFAYEWTHPPLAKFGMVLGMSVFGENALGWRIPGALLGTAAVYLIYRIAKSLFEDEALSLLSAFIFSLEGLPLVSSRIGMNDTYFLFFALLAILMYIKERDLLGSIFLGLSLSAKWSALWVYPIIIAGRLILKRKVSAKILLYFLIPPMVYLIVYIPFFRSGHTFRQFLNLEMFRCIGFANCTYEFGLQQQMWWYHTNLKATHAYTSPWWSWPLNTRPVYLYTSEVVNGMVSRIYMTGNPFVLWAGFVSVLASVYLWVKEGSRKLLFVIFSYFIFFVPWALSPRIMFLYHYLPSIPFLAISMAYTLRRFPALIYPALFAGVVCFVYFYPHWTGIAVPEWLDLSYYWLHSWR